MIIDVKLRPLLNIAQERDDGSGAAVLWPGPLQPQCEPRPGARLRQPRGENRLSMDSIVQCFSGSQQNCQVFAQVIQFRNSSSWRRSLQGEEAIRHYDNCYYYLFRTQLSSFWTCQESSISRLTWTSNSSRRIFCMLPHLPPKLSWPSCLGADIYNTL